MVYITKNYETKKTPDFNVRCPRCCEIKPREKFNNKNKKWMKENINPFAKPYVCPVCNDCQKEMDHYHKILDKAIEHYKVGK